MIATLGHMPGAEYTSASMPPAGAAIGAPVSGRTAGPRAGSNGATAGTGATATAGTGTIVGASAGAGVAVATGATAPGATAVCMHPKNEKPIHQRVCTHAVFGSMFEYITNSTSQE